MICVFIIGKHKQNTAMGFKNFYQYESYNYNIDMDYDVDDTIFTGYF